MRNIFDMIPTYGWPIEGGTDVFKHFIPFHSRKPYYMMEGTSFVPPADISETGKEYTIYMDIPGIDMKDLDITYKNGIVTIKGEKKNNIKEDECYHHTERYDGAFERTFKIPDFVNEEEIDASYKDGILKVVFAKTEASHVKKIEVKH